MAIGFPAFSEKSVKFRGASRKKLLRVADDALEELGWHPRKDDKWSLHASVPIGFYIIFLTWGAHFTVDVEEERLHLRSEGVFVLEWLDVGQHSENIKKFLDRVDDILEDSE